MPFARLLSLTALLVLAPCCPGGAQDRSAREPRTFALGDGRDKVRSVQGPPEVIERLPSLGSETWSWRSATVRFSVDEGRVISWQDPQHELRVTAQGGGVPTANRLIGLGSAAADVLRILGRPVAAAFAGGREQWSYRSQRAVIVVDSARRTVSGWTDPDRRLPVVESDRAEGERATAPPRSGPGTAPASVERGVPRLQIAVTLRDTTVAARMAGAANVLRLTVKNVGDGTAFSVEPYTLVTPAGGAQASVVWAETIASILPGESVSRDTPIRFPSSLLSDRVVLLAGAREQNGHAIVPEVRVELPVVPSRAPRLAAVVIEQEDQSGDGRVSPREVVDLRLRLANVGSGDLTGASALLSLGRDVFAAAGTPSRLELPTVRPGDSVDVRFSVYTNARAESIAVRVLVRDVAGREVMRIAVPLRMTGRPASAAEGSSPSVVAPGTGGTDVDAPFPVRTPLNPDAVAVLFGVDYYRSLPRARFAARDASTMRTYVTGVFGVPDDADHVLLRQDGDATQGELRRAFGETGWLARRVRPQSDVVVYFAGHGAADKGGAPLILPYDADVNYPRETAMQLAELYALLAKLPARRIIVVIDACFSGLSRGGVSLTEGARPIVVSIEHPALLRNGMAVFAAVQGAQSANDLPDKQHGLFSYQFFRALRGGADADGDGSLTVEEIDRFVTRETRAAAARQDKEQSPLIIARERSLTVARIPPAKAKP